MVLKPNHHLNRTDHCGFADLNFAGRCIAFCAYNIARKHVSDYIGRSGGTDYEAGREVQLKGRRIENYATETTTTTDRKNRSYSGWKLEDFSKLRQGS